MALPSLREARLRRIVGGGHEGQTLGGSGRSDRSGASLRRTGARRGGHRRARARVRRARRRGAESLGPRRSRAGTRVLRLRRQVPRRQGEAPDPGAGLRGRGGRGAAAGRRGLPDVPRLGHGARGLLPGALDRPRPRQRDQHAPRLHRDLDVPQALGGQRPAAAGSSSTSSSAWRSRGAIGAPGS